MAALWDAPAETPAVEILPECMAAVELFLACSTQWRVAGQAGLPIGLDYAAVAVVARARRTRLDAELLGDLQIVESAAAAAIAEARKP